MPMGSDMGEKLFDVGETKPVEVELEAPPPAKIDIARFSPPLPFESLTGATFSPDRKHRYLLWRRLLEKGPIINFVGVNPSTAAEEINDPTIVREIGFSKDMGFAVLWKTNLFAIRSTDPKQLRWEDDPIGAENDRYLIQAADESDMVVLCPGNWGYLRGRYTQVLNLLSACPKIKAKIHHFGMTKRNFPRHTLYLSRKRRPVPMFVEEVEVPL
jgi:hypothetical protein